MSSRHTLAFLSLSLTQSTSALVGCDDHGHSYDKPQSKQATTSPTTAPTTAPSADHSHGTGGSHTHE